MHETVHGLNTFKIYQTKNKALVSYLGKSRGDSGRESQFISKYSRLGEAVNILTTKLRSPFSAQRILSLFIFGKTIPSGVNWSLSISLLIMSSFKLSNFF